MPAVATAVEATDVRANLRMSCPALPPSAITTPAASARPGTSCSQVVRPVALAEGNAEQSVAEHRGQRLLLEHEAPGRASQPAPSHPRHRQQGADGRQRGCPLRRPFQTRVEDRLESSPRKRTSSLNAWDRPTPEEASHARQSASVGAPGRSRTCDLSLRRRLLYPLRYWGG